MASYSEYEEMLKTFRCQDLANLLATAGQAKNGKKSELYDRCLGLLKKGSTTIQFKIREIYNAKISAGIYSPITISGIPSSSTALNVGNPYSNYRYSNNYPYTSFNNNNNNNNSMLPPPPIPSSTAATSSSFLNADQHNYPIRNSQSMARSINSTTTSSIRVQFERLAFYELLHELCAPIRMQTQTTHRPFSFTFNFSMTPDQTTEISGSRESINDKFEFSKQIHLRFGYNETQLQKDNLPPNLIVTVNGKPVTLPVSIPFLLNEIQFNLKFKKLLSVTKTNK
jgi:hypothetical protein